MKKIKGLVTALMILTMMVGSIGFAAASNELTNNESIDGGYTTLELGDPNPIAF